MTSSNMHHMAFLDLVAASDTAVLRRKEETYRGSWKAAGGRSAWFMARRNMDRLLVMMAKPKDMHGFSIEDLDDLLSEDKEEVTLATEVIQYLRDCYVQENIFAKIRENPRGQDGTVLACLRDLRRYFMLIEAEMIARGYVTAEQSFEPKDPDHYGVTVGQPVELKIEIVPPANRGETSKVIQQAQEPADDHTSFPGADNNPIFVGTVVQSAKGREVVSQVFKSGLVELLPSKDWVFANTLIWWPVDKGYSVHVHNALPPLNVGEMYLYTIPKNGSKISARLTDRQSGIGEGGWYDKCLIDLGPQGTAWVDAETLSPLPEANKTKVEVKDVSVMVSQDTPSCGDGSFDDKVRQRTSEDGGHHSNLFPWVVDMAWRQRNNYLGPNQERVLDFNTDYKQKAPGVWTLEPYINTKPRVAQHVYHAPITKEGYWRLRIEDCPPDARDMFPRVEREVNTMTRDELPEWQRDMYTWVEDQTKWVISKAFEAWVG